MSPTKPRPALARKVPSSATASSIPRRVKTSSKLSTKAESTSSTTTDPLKKKISTKSSQQSAKNVSIFSDPAATLAPAHVVSYFSNTGGANKENMPCPGRPTVHRANNGGSPIRLRSGISKTGFQKPSLSPYKKRTFGYSRVPLRELDTQEVFERDEAVLGDLRRRRSGEHSGTVIEIDSVLAFPSPDTTNAVRASSTNSSSTEDTTSTAPTEYEEHVLADDDYEKLHVLRRSDSEEALRVKLDAILASTSTGAKGKAKASKTTRQRSVHPAIRQMSPGFSPYRSEASAPSSPAKSYIESPLRIRRSPSPIAKASPSPIRPLPRMGLGTKAINTILSEKKLVATIEGKNGEKAKKIIINTSAATGEALKKKKAVKKVGTSSLRRAAGGTTASAPARDPSRPPLALTGGRVMGLEGMRKMR